MKTLITILMIIIGASCIASGQAKMSGDEQVKTQIIALEKGGWEAWKNKDASWTKTNTTEEFLLVNSDGLANKADVIKATSTDCVVKSYSLDNYKFVMTDKDSALMTYTAMQDGVCSGKAIPSKVRASVVYVKRGGKWLEALYMETPIAQ
jgi:hypothetical protein